MSDRRPTVEDALQILCIGYCEYGHVESCPLGSDKIPEFLAALSRAAVEQVKGLRSIDASDDGLEYSNIHCTSCHMELETSDDDCGCIYISEELARRTVFNVSNGEEK